MKAAMSLDVGLAASSGTVSNEGGAGTCVALLLFGAGGFAFGAGCVVISSGGGPSGGVGCRLCGSAGGPHPSGGGCCLGGTTGLLSSGNGGGDIGLSSQVGGIFGGGFVIQCGSLALPRA